MKDREYQKAEHRERIATLTKAFNPTLNLLQQITLMYTSSGKTIANAHKKQIQTLTDNMFVQAIPVLKRPDFSALGTVLNSNQIKMYPLEGNNLVKFVFNNESRSIHVYDMKTKRAISLTQNNLGNVTVTTSKFQLVNGISDLETNWKKLTA